MKIDYRADILWAARSASTTSAGARSFVAYLTGRLERSDPDLAEQLWALISEAPLQLTERYEPQQTHPDRQ